MEKIKAFFERNEIVKLAVVLCLITSVTALILGSVNSITAPKIKEIQMQATYDAMRELIAAGEEFDEQKVDEESDPTVKNFYHALSGDQIVGYAVQVAPNGFGGPLEMLVSFDANGVVTGTKIISMSETPGLGTKIVDEPSFAEQYIGKSEVLNSVKASTGADTDIVAITGATVSSTAMTTGVSTAISYLAANK